MLRQGKKSLAEATANPRPASMRSVRRNVTETKKSKVNSVPIENNKEIFESLGKQASIH